MFHLKYVKYIKYKKKKHRLGGRGMGCVYILGFIGLKFCTNPEKPPFHTQQKYEYIMSITHPPKRLKPIIHPITLH